MKGKRIPSWTIEDFEGKTYLLSDFRQKSHVILIYKPDSTSAERVLWSVRIKSEAAKWDWLRVTFLFVSKAPEGLVPAVYFIDRWGIFQNELSLSDWSFESIEEDVTYYEAKHC